MKRLVVILTALLLVVGLGSPAGTGKAAAAAAPAYNEISTFVDGKLIISTAKSLLVNSSAYVPVKLLDQIPGISMTKTATGISVSGAKGATTLNKDNSVLYNNSNYVAFKTLLNIGAIDGKYASSAYSLFIWSGDEGKAKSNATLTALSKLPRNFGSVVGKKVYVYGFPGTHWITDVQYDGSSSIEYSMLKDDGTAWTLDQDIYDEAMMYTVEYLQYLKKTFNGTVAWVRNSQIEDSPFKNMEKVTIKSVQADNETGDVDVVLRRASGEEITITLAPVGDQISNISSTFLYKSPRTLTNSSDKMWAAIVAEKVVVGMTFDEVYFSWGDPDRTNESLGLVVYGNVYLYFYNGKLKSISEL
ncbi:hypothetical protein [Paenibacillus agri]|uniref:Copper amine oxidase-like N-terminal domain-containing protein n=1 Tax=Paenibacillus agri TaxID=2744309 RepID=A0A850EJU1_9BACL|nr:hypothetical protein [Paenibacillus agri]NUU59654.1 hypothetical protein [Paenibacillus agri]